MAILVEIHNPRHKIGMIDHSLPGAEELGDSVTSGYKQLFTDEDGNLDLTKELLFLEIINGIVKQAQAHTLMRLSKEKEENNNANQEI